MYRINFRIKITIFAKDNNAILEFAKLGDFQYIIFYFNNGNTVAERNC